MGESSANLSKGSARAASRKGAADQLVARLMSDNGFEREKARLELVALGEQAVPRLVAALKDKRERMRWEAAKALGQIGSPAAAPALIETLEDNNFDVRWLSAEALVSVGQEALEPLLVALGKDPESLWLRDSAHHILAHWTGEDISVEHHQADHPSRKDTGLQDILKPVVAAIHGSEPLVEVPLRAGIALDLLKRRARA